MVKSADKPERDNDASTSNFSPANPPQRRPVLLATAIALLAIWFAAMVYIAFFLPAP